MKILLVLGALIASATTDISVAAATENWRGTFDGGRDPSRIFIGGINVLVVKRAYVWDNGEGESPEGSGSDRAWYGVKHGPYGNIHILVYAPDQETLLNHTRLHGPWETGNAKFEWLDDEGLEYIRYGIHLWDAFHFDKVWVRIYESDPKNGIGFLREHDPLMSMWVSKYESYCGLRYESHHIPLLELATVDLSGDRAWSNERRLLVGNRTGETINVYAQSYTLHASGRWDWTPVLGPYRIARNAQPTYIIDGSEWRVSGTYLHIWAISVDGRYGWRKYEDMSLYIGTPCPLPFWEDYAFTFK